MLLRLVSRTKARKNNYFLATFSSLRRYFAIKNTTNAMIMKLIIAPSRKFSAILNGNKFFLIRFNWLVKNFKKLLASSEILFILDFSATGY